MRKEEKRQDAITELKNEEIASVDYVIDSLTRLRSCLERADSIKQVHECKENYKNRTYEKQQNLIDRQQDKIENQLERLQEKMRKLDERKLKLNE